MRSYYAHLTTTQHAPPGAITPRPIYRTSSVFPVIQKPGVTSRVIFMGYWILKRRITEISAVITLRNPEGKILARHTFPITEPKTFRIELADELERAGFSRDAAFEGSLEAEFFSTQNLFFPFPATVINYYGPAFSTLVHTAQRVYNDFEDMVNNSQTEVPESGFNFYADAEREPFIGLINGCVEVPDSALEMRFINHAQQSLECKLDLGHLNPYETKWIYPARHCDLKGFFAGRPGSGKIHCHLNWTFPRLLVGNVHPKLPAMTITHTYYDCSEAKNDSDYWRPAEPGWHDAALMLPAEIVGQHFTNIYFYPIYSPSRFAIDAEIYDEEGKLLAQKRDALVIEAPKTEVHRLDVKELCLSLGVGTEKERALRLIARPLEGGRIPSRIKLGLDIGNGAVNTPCNICTNLQPFNPSLEAKPTSFRWSPVLADQPMSTLWLMNSSPAADYRRNADLVLTFYRESDTRTLSRTITLPPHGFAFIRVHEDMELMEFCEGKVGWVTVTSTNPYTTTYYFNENLSGVVGGDHGF